MVLAIFHLFSIDVVYQFEWMSVVLVNKIIVFYFN